MTDLPLLQVMINKVLAKGLTIEVVETADYWCGKVISTRHVEGNIFDVTIQQEADNVVVKTGFTIRQPDRWKLAKDDAGEWKLYPPRSSKTKLT